MLEAQHWTPSHSDMIFNGWKRTQGLFIWQRSVDSVTPSQKDMSPAPFNDSLSIHIPSVFLNSTLFLHCTVSWDVDFCANFVVMEVLNFPA